MTDKKTKKEFQVLLFLVFFLFYTNNSFSNELEDYNPYIDYETSEDKKLEKNLILDPIYNEDNFSKEIVKSTKNNPIEIYKIGHGDYKIAFIGVVHGDEAQGEYIIRELIKLIDKNKNLVENKSLLLIPVINPDALKKKTRVNSNGVDINRNFPTKDWVKSKYKNRYYSGQKPSSEIETNIIINQINDFEPNLIITIHAPYKVINYDSDAIKICELLSKYNGYKIVNNIGYVTHGSLGTYFGKERNIPVITLETSNANGEISWKENKNAFFYLLSTIYN